MGASRALMTLDYESLKGIAARYAARVTSQNRAGRGEAPPSVRVAYLSRTLAHQKANALVADSRYHG